MSGRNKESENNGVPPNKPDEKKKDDWFHDPKLVVELQRRLAEMREKLPLATNKTLDRTIYHKPF